MARNTKDSGEKAQEFSERVTQMNMGEAGEQIREIGERVQSGLSEAGRKLRSGRKFNQAAVPDVFRKVPKVISPRVHAWLDVAVTGYFAVLGTVSAFRGRRRAATAAFINAGVVAGVSMFTDYNGTGKKPISFKLHGTLDAIQGTTAALAPVLHGFTGKREAALFYGQALNELAVIAMTDWDAGMPKESQRKAA